MYVSAPLSRGLKRGRPEKLEPQTLCGGGGGGGSSTKKLVISALQGGEERGDGRININACREGEEKPALLGSLVFLGAEAAFSAVIMLTM